MSTLSMALSSHSPEAGNSQPSRDESGMAAVHSADSHSSGTDERAAPRKNAQAMLPKNTKQGLKSLFDQGTDVFSSFAELRRQVLEQKDRAALSKIYGMAQHGYIDAINFLGYLYGVSSRNGN